jgi:hypothetical protein
MDQGSRDFDLRIVAEVEPETKLSKVEELSN